MPSLGPHVALSAAVGVGIWSVTGHEPAIPVALAAGGLPDAERWSRLIGQSGPV